MRVLLICFGLLLVLSFQPVLGWDEDLSRIAGIHAPEPRSEFPYFVSSSVRALHDDLYRDVFRVLREDGLFFNNESSRAKTPFIFTGPEDIGNVLDLSLPEKRVDHATLVEIVKTVIKFSPRASHPFKVDRHGGGLDPYALAGDWIGTLIASLVLTYYLAPVYTLMEYELEGRVRELVGYPEGRGDGMITPGAGMGNGYAIQLALRDKFPSLRTKGFTQLAAPGCKGPRPMVFISEDASFAFEKYCVWEGIGLEGCKRVRTDARGRMSLEHLEADIQQSIEDGFTPFMLVGTTGTPILGAIDPLEELADTAGKYGLWFHVDGHLSGSNFLSDKQKSSLKGIERSDSFLWSPDRGLATTYSTGVLVTRKEDAMKDTFAIHADYVFADSTIYNTSRWDNGDNTMQTTRRPDVAKIWFMWKAKGQERLAQHIDYTYDLTAFAVEHLKSRQDFDLILNSFDSNQVAFQYRTPQCRGQVGGYTEDCLRLNNATERIREKLLKNGVLSISANSIPSKSMAPFFVMRLANSAISPEDVVYMLDQIEAEGSNQVGNINESGKFEFGRSAEIKIPDIRSQFPDYVSAPIESLHGDFIDDFFNLALQNGTTYFQDLRDEGVPLPFLQPEQLLRQFDFSLDTPLGTMEENGTELLALIRNIIKHSAHNGHPYYNDHLSLALDPYTLMADYVIGAINSPMITYEDNPLFTLMETELLREIRKLGGYPNPERGDGLTLPGGSASNEVALMLAHMRKAKEARVKGNSGGNQTLVLFISIGSHYSSDKGAFFSGIGLDNVVHIDQDARGRMSVPDLKRKISKAVSEGKTPFLVTATAGTTVRGAFDPIDEIADICQEYGMWFHVDGAYGGSSLFTSNKTRRAEQFRGLERTDSFSLNPHKSFGVSRESSFLVTRHEGILKVLAPTLKDQEFNNWGLYDSDKYDHSMYSAFPDRRGNIFKMWFLWKAKGFEGLAAHIDYGYELTWQVYEYLRSKPDKYILLHPDFPPECTSINFYYVPRSYRDQLETRRNDLEFWWELEHIQNELRRRIVLSNRISICDGRPATLPNTLILNLYNSAVSFEDAKYMLDIVDYYGKDL